MSSDRVTGLAETYALFGTLDDAAREELGVELAIIAREGLQAQQAATPRLTSALASGLSLKLELDKLRARFGLLGLKSGRARLFYGRFVNFGRRAQTVLVERRRRVNGQLRLEPGRRRKRASDIVKRYSLRVKARAPVNFIDAPGRDFERLAAGQLAEFWSRTVDRAGGRA